MIDSFNQRLLSSYFERFSSAVFEGRRLLNFSKDNANKRRDVTLDLPQIVTASIICNTAHKTPCQENLLMDKKEVAIFQFIRSNKISQSNDLLILFSLSLASW